MQLPLGVAIDRFGPKRCMLVCAAVVIASALMFACGRTPAELTAARVIMGVGTSCYLLGFQVVATALYLTARDPLADSRASRDRQA